MANEYSFKQETCYCSADLTELKVAVTSYRFGRLPQGKCPNCGRELLLDAPTVETPVMPEAMSPPSATPKRSRKPEPEPKPEKEPD